MSDNPLAQILEMDGEERYDYFLDAVVEEREIWILVNADNQFLKIVSDEDGVAYLPVWPGSEFARLRQRLRRSLPKRFLCRISSGSG